MQVVGDELQYLLLCPFSKGKRIELLPKYYFENTIYLKCNKLFKTNKLLLLKFKHFICLINSFLQ